jgi:hypothetical protein
MPRAAEPEIGGVFPEDSAFAGPWAERYRIVRPLSQGGMGAVYVAE